MLLDCEPDLFNRLTYLGWFRPSAQANELLG